MNKKCVNCNEEFDVEFQEYLKEHTKKCPQCGGVARNQAPNGAGIAEECGWHCIICGWSEE